MVNKKIIFSDAWKVEVGFEDIETGCVKPEEIIVKNHYSLVSAGTELACLAGKESSWFKFPSTPGYTSVGEIVACGSSVKDFKVGDMVFCYGSHSSYVKVDTVNDFCVKLPNGVEESHAVFARIGTIAMTAVRNSNIELGDYVGVTGMGVVGNIAAQLAKAQGGFVVGMDLDEQRLEIAKSCGIPFNIKLDMENAKEKVEEITGGGINTLIEATGVTAAAVNALPLMAKGGEVILLGTPRDEYNSNVTEVLRSFHLASSALTLKPAHEWIYPVKTDPFVKHSFERNTKIIFELIKNNTLQISPLLSHIIEPEKAPEAYEALRKRDKEYVGVVIKWDI